MDCGEIALSTTVYKVKNKLEINIFLLVSGTALIKAVLAALILISICDELCCCFFMNLFFLNF